MKSRLGSFVLMSSLGLNVYFLYDANNEAGTITDRVSKEQSALKISKSQIPEKRHENNIEIIEDEILPQRERRMETENLETENEKELKEKIDLSEDTYNKAQKRWNKETRAYMERDLGMDPEVADFYFEISKRRQKEIDSYLAPLMDPSGNEEPYMFSIDDNINIARINEKYLNLLKSSMGPENYQRYKKFRNTQNKKMMEEGQGYFWIEF